MYVSISSLVLFAAWPFLDLLTMWICLAQNRVGHEHSFAKLKPKSTDRFRRPYWISLRCNLLQQLTLKLISISPIYIPKHLTRYLAIGLIYPPCGCFLVVPRTKPSTSTGGANTWTQHSPCFKKKNERKATITDITLFLIKLLSVQIGI